jgi:hypothetical protein
LFGAVIGVTAAAFVLNCSFGGSIDVWWFFKQSIFYTFTRHVTSFRSGCVTDCRKHLVRAD